MTADSTNALIGKVATHVIRREIEHPEEEAGFAKLVMHRLTRQEMAAVARAVLGSPILSQQVEIALPRHHFTATDQLDATLLVDEPITELRCKPCTAPRTARLMALVDDSQASSMAKAPKITRDTFLDEELVDVWVSEAANFVGVSFPDEVTAVLNAALCGLIRCDRFPLQRFARYVAEVIEGVEKLSPKYALGSALWCLQIPSFRDTFVGIKNNRPSDYERAYSRHWRNECYLLKRTPQQVPFAQRDLEKMLDASRSAGMVPHAIAALEAFVKAGDGWTQEAENLAKLDWSEVQPFFAQAPKPKEKTLGDKTDEIFRLLAPDRFEPADWTYVEQLKLRGKRITRADGDVEFYNKRLREIHEDPPLAARWESFIFGREIPCTDFHVGMLHCLQRLTRVRDEIDGSVHLEITAVESEKIRLRRKSADACQYFEARYKNLESLWSGIVVFRKFEIFGYSKLVESWRDDKSSRTSGAKKANQLTFKVRLTSQIDETNHTEDVRLVWEFPSDSVLQGYPGDLRRCYEYVEVKKKSPLLFSNIELNSRIAKWPKPTISLEDVCGLQPPSSNCEQGSFVPRAKNSTNLGDEYMKALNALTTKHFIDAETNALLGEQFKSFGDTYSAAVCELFMATGEHAAIAAQAAAYMELLSAICQRVSAESARTQLLRPLLQIGQARIRSQDASTGCAIVCPWHPLRMEAIAAKERRFAELVARLLESKRPLFSDQTGELFFRDVQLDLETPGLPEVSLFWTGEDSELLTASDHLGAYSLLEIPVAREGKPSVTNENPKRTAQQISEVIRSYLDLQPHERDNFSIVLFNCDSKALPVAVVEAISDSDSDSPEDAMCQVILTHQDRKLLAEFYETISAQEGDDDAFYVSEATKDFMARVRINILVDQGVRPSADSEPLTDIVFCQDVASRHADLSREPMTRVGYTVPPENLVIHRWSRKRQFVSGDNSSVLLLTCPAQTAAGWAYLYAVAMITDADYAKRAWADSACLVPAKRLNFDKRETARVFDETHALGNWVVNLDDLLDRRILKHRNIKVIRYRHSASAGRNLIISSTARDTLLQATLLQKLSNLLPTDLMTEDRRAVAQQFINQANEISGNLVLRAARRGANANELIGLVLSHHIVATELGLNRHALCFLLDDYANWLGQTEDRIADLIILSPKEGTNRNKCLDIIMTEAKFISFDQLSVKANESRRQLRDSLRLLERALKNSEACLDQELWLARLSDLFMEGIQNLDQNVDIVAWRSAIRARDVEICLRGYSHVFIHGPADHENDGARFTGIDGCSGWQEIFSRANVKLLVQSYVSGSDGKDILDLRMRLSGMPIVQHEYRPLPSVAQKQDQPPVIITTAIKGAETEASKFQVGTAQNVGGTAGAGDATLATHTSPLSFVQDLLAKTPSHDDRLQESPTWAAEMVTRLKHALLKREMSAEVIEIRETPNALLCRMKGSDRLTVDLVEAKASEIKTTDGLHIIGVREGLGEVIIMLARPSRKKLFLQEVWRNWNPSPDGNTKLLIALKEIDGEPLFLSPYPQPHTLIAGFTGSGKSNLLENILLGIMATNSPNQARIAIIDPKSGLDYQIFDELPHLLFPTITDMDAAVKAIEGVVAEMEERYKRFREARVQNIDGFTKKTGAVMPRIWLIHDEFGDWMQIKSYEDAVTPLVNRLVQKARAGGIYLIFASQRPDNTCFPMILRSNLNNRLVLRVDSPGTSEIATGQKNMAAEKLLGEGHLLALLGNYPDPVYAQVPFVSHDDLQEIVQRIKDRYAVETTPGL
jgi:S-DNA-T family DNA segregation ATPase FtsK/SpoIIIE